MIWARSLGVVVALSLMGACRASPADDAARGQTSAAASAPHPRDLTGANRETWRRVLAWPEGCERAFQVAGNDSVGVEMYRLRDGRVLAQVMCSLGAYQGTYRFYLVDTSATPPRAEAVTFPDLVDSGIPGPNRLRREPTQEVVGLPTWVPAEDRLNVLRRFRGIGDCGLYLSYSIGDSTARLTEARGKLDCGGGAKAARDPAHWPVLPAKDDR